MSQNRHRAWRAEQCFDFDRSLAGGASPNATVAELVSDIGHDCIAHDPTYRYLLARGVSHWRLEMTDPDGREPFEAIHPSTKAMTMSKTNRQTSTTAIIDTRLSHQGEVAA